MRGRFLRDLWLGGDEEAEWKEINDQLTALSAWRRLGRRLRGQPPVGATESARDELPIETVPIETVPIETAPVETVPVEEGEA
jgi:hypothetical protein